MQFLTIKTFTQPVLPPLTIGVQAVQDLNFGTFCLSHSGASGGTVDIGWDGGRSSTGEIILLSIAPIHSPAIFDINLTVGRNIIITYSPTAILTDAASNEITLNIGPTEMGGSGSSFPVTDDHQFNTQLRIGGSLEIGPHMSNPPGSYTGSFSITFNQE